LDLSRIGIINLPPLGCLPFEKTLRINVGGECAEEVNEAAVLFNAKLISTIDGLKSKLPGLKIVSLNYYDIVLGAIKDPAKYGILELYSFLILKSSVGQLVLKNFPYNMNPDLI